MTSTGLRAGAESVEAVSRRAAGRTRRARRCCARSKARGRSSSKCRRSSARAPTATRAAWRAASISSGCRCCSRCSRSAPACNLIGDDVFVNIAGGMTVDEPASDLGVLAAIASSVRNRVIPPTTAMFGEVGLAGEVRGITQAALRVREAAQMGFTPLHHARGEHRPVRSASQATASWSASERRRSARRASVLETYPQKSWPKKTPRSLRSQSEFDCARALANSETRTRKRATLSANGDDMTSKPRSSSSTATRCPAPGPTAVRSTSSPRQALAPSPRHPFRNNW